MCRLVIIYRVVDFGLTIGVGAVGGRICGAVGGHRGNASGIVHAARPAIHRTNFIPTIARKRIGEIVSPAEASDEHRLRINAEVAFRPAEKRIKKGDIHASLAQIPTLVPPYFKPIRIDGDHFITGSGGIGVHATVIHRQAIGSRSVEMKC
jgi:hypothetical protein